MCNVYKNGGVSRWKNYVHVTKNSSKMLYFVLITIEGRHSGKIKCFETCLQRRDFVQPFCALDEQRKCWFTIPSNCTYDLVKCLRKLAKLPHCGG
ncbi:uncharacterized protein LOC111078229 isoform X2 [Drosophila obscura]|uniref:uncharacterized protein LOC111078229 isoform X2 n=1 Tax=Drosophila obscura TaxID=7282 RepID=UPI001BB18A3C|nr:uncharacterized protein LOC111078229 isoform X2 [Drosophila obscura]